MTLPASGPISLNQIADEFGLSRQAAFPSAFYGKGGAATSGPLSFTDFYGRSGVPPIPVSTFSPDGGSVSDEEAGYASATLSCNNTATWTYTGGTGGSATLASGGSGTSITFSVTAPGNPSRSATWNVTGSSNGVTRTFTVNLTADGNLS